MKGILFLPILAVAMAASAFGKTPKTLMLADSDVATVHTALGFTTMLTFDSRPSTVILGDQDAFKIERAGNGLAIKPVVPHAATNLFVFTDYDRYNFKLMTGLTSEADYVLKIDRPRPKGYPTERSDKKNDPKAPDANPDALIRKSVGKTSECGGLKLTVDAIAWTESQSSDLIQFEIKASPKLLQGGPLSFEPGDIEIEQGSTPLLIQSLYLERLEFTDHQPTVKGNLILKQIELKKGAILTLGFRPDFHSLKYPKCPWVSFSSQGTRMATAKTRTVGAPKTQPSK